MGNNYKLVVIDSWAKLCGNNTRRHTPCIPTPVVSPSSEFMNLNIESW